MEENLVNKYVSLNDVSLELSEKISKLLESCFTQKNKIPEEKAEHDDKYCSKKDRIGFSLAVKENQVIGVVVILKRIIPYQGKQIILGGIGGVCINEKFRRKGIAKKLLKIAVGKLKEEKCDIAYLCTDTENLVVLYEPFCFNKLKKQYTYLGKSGKRYFEWGGMIAPINSTALFQQIMEGKESFDIGIGNW